MNVKIEKPILFIPEFLAKSGVKYNETLFNGLANLFDISSREIIDFYVNDVYPVTNDKYRLETKRIPWHLRNTTEQYINSQIGRKTVTLGKEGEELKDPIFTTNFYPILSDEIFSLEQRKVKLNITNSDLRNLKDLDIYIKNVAGIGNCLLGYDAKESFANNESFNSKAKALLNLLIDDTEGDYWDDKDKQRLVFADIVMSKRDKPYEFIPKSNILFIIPRTGFANLLYSNTREFSSLLYSDIVREYRNAFGGEELYGSTLFNSYCCMPEVR